MTALVFIVGLALAYAHWKLAAVGWLIAGNLTIYVALFTATLASACVAAFRSDDARCIYGALVLVLNFVVSHFAWTTSDPLLIDGINNAVSAAWFVFTGQTRWEFTVGGLLLVAAGAAVLANFGVIPDHLNRDNSRFIAWSYPDIVAILGHTCNIALGFGAGDAGRRIKVAMEPRPMVFAARHHLVARLRALAPAGKSKGGEAG